MFQIIDISISCNPFPIKLTRVEQSEARDQPSVTMQNHSDVQIYTTFVMDKRFANNLLDNIVLSDIIRPNKIIWVEKVSLKIKQNIIIFFLKSKIFYSSSVLLTECILMVKNYVLKLQAPLFNMKQNFA